MKSQLSLISYFRSHFNICSLTKCPVSTLIPRFDFLFMHFPDQGLLVPISKCQLQQHSDIVLPYYTRTQ
jgi:hypothetical protein